MEKMSAIGAFEGIDITNSKALVDLKLDKPTAKDRDLLVEVTAVSVNPVDFKVRQRLKKAKYLACLAGMLLAQWLKLVNKSPISN